MEKFRYKYFMRTIEVDVSKEAVSHRGKMLNANEITGFGIELIPTTRMAGMNAGGAIGGLISYKMTKKRYDKFDGELNKTAPFSEIPDKMANLVIAYKKMDQPPEAKAKALYATLNTKDPECLRMLNTLKKYYGSKYVGIGMTGKVTKALNVSMAAMIIVIITVVVIVTAIIVVAAIANS
jgi:hypothetical protein